MIGTEEERRLFATELRTDKWTTAFLWRPDGHQGSSICILKEVWFNTGRFPEVPKDQGQCVVFHLYNYLDPSKAHSSDSGYRVNPLDQPFLRLEDALALAEQHEREALANGKWVRLEDIKPS